MKRLAILAVILSFLFVAPAQAYTVDSARSVVKSVESKSDGFVQFNFSQGRNFASFNIRGIRPAAGTIYPAPWIISGGTIEIYNSPADARAAARYHKKFYFLVTHNPDYWKLRPGTVLPHHIYVSGRYMLSLSPYISRATTERLKTLFGAGRAKFTEVVYVEEKP